MFGIGVWETGVISRVLSIVVGVPVLVLVILWATRRKQ